MVKEFAHQLARDLRSEARRFFILSPRSPAETGAACRPSGVDHASARCSKYEFEADWHLLDTCNYRCAYCFFPPDMLGSTLRTFASPHEWRSAFDATGAVWLLHITGGEPSIYPQFVELCEGLTERHYISINSNLTHRSLATFAQRIDPSRVNFINAGLHLEERDNRSGIDVFLRHADQLRARGFSILTSLVATPRALARFSEAVRLLEPIGLYPIPKLLRGRFEGRMYPKAYSEADKSRFRAFAAVARKFYDPMIGRMDERPSIDMFNDDHLLDGLQSFRGISCEAGHRFVSVRPNGAVFRCANGSLGNILNGTFTARTGPAPCDTKYCYYFCSKYTRQVEPLPVTSA